MELTPMNVSEIQSVLAEYDLSPNKVLGQNFIIHTGVLKDLIETAKISSKDTIVEVGGGIGIITKALAETGARIITVEKDKNLIPILKKLAKEYKNIEVAEGDILTFNPVAYKLTPKNYKLVGNPPYYLTGRLFRVFLEDPTRRPASITVVIQKEVAKRILQTPPRMNILALSIQVFGAPAVVSTISRSAFWPPPNVQSALLHIDIFEEPRIPESKIKDLFHLAKDAFMHPRKQLKNNIPEDILKRGDIDPKRRPQTLTIEEWEELT